MVKDHVKHNPHPVLGQGSNHLFDIFHGAQVGVNGVVVGDIVAIIVLRGGEEGIEPDHIHAQGSDIGNFLDNAA